MALQGSRQGRSAFALINAHWTRTLAAGGYRVLDYDPAGPPPDVLIHHDFASRFTDFVPPPGTRCVAVRPWDFGPPPPAWVEKINREFERYWAPSTWIAQQAQAGGVDTSRIRLVPLGIDPALFRPEGSRFPLPTEKTFRFLFVGGVSLRKGSDVLLQAYRRAFSRSDDVCLVLKDHSGDLFYRENHARAGLAAWQSAEDAPEVVHLDTFLPETSLAALYRSCEAAVFPYRAEGFCLPILEAMACGAPALVPRFGACLDYCSEATSYFLKVRRIRAPVQRSFSVALGFEETLSEVDFCEVEVDTLAEALRAVRNGSRAEREAKAARGAALARDHHTWEQVGGIVLSELRQLGIGLDELGPATPTGPASAGRPGP